MSKTRTKRYPLRWAAAALIALGGGGALAADSAPGAAGHAHAAPAASAPFALVGDTAITHEQFDFAFAQAARAKFFHGKPPENEIAALQREVGQSLVDEVLLVKEAQRRGIRADAASVQRAIDGYDERYRNSQEWQGKRATVLPNLRGKLERDSVLEQLKAQVRAVSEPGGDDLQRYWQAHQDKFTTPEQVRLSVILLKVDPSSTQSVWAAAQEEADAILRQLAAGGGFQDIARLRSADPSAERGGDMGFVHRAMLPDPAQAAIDKLEMGTVSQPVLLLEGVAVFRLDGRKPSQLNALDTVRERVRDLWLRDEAQHAWTAFVERLRLATPVKLDDSRWLPLTTAATSTGERASP